MIKSRLREIYLASPFRWLGVNRVRRTEVVQACIDALGAKTYLEIGVSSGDCFREIQVPRKIGVDPIPAAPGVKALLSGDAITYHQVKSDEFFAALAIQELPNGVDVVFIDGLHTFEQAYRDCLNALDHLRPGGIILLHDCLPKTPAEGVAASSYDEARKLNGPDWNGDWTGDVWKAVVALRSLHPELRAEVLDCDHGIGIVRKERSRPSLGFSLQEVEALGFEDLVADRAHLLGLKRPALLHWILLKQRYRERRS